MSAPRQLERRRQRIEEVCGAAIRALTGQTELRFRGHRLHRGARPLIFGAPHLQADPLRDDFVSHRGIADGMALRLRHSDAELHAALLPDQQVPRLVFEMLEQFRVESLAPGHLPGVRHNINRRVVRWCEAFHAARLTESRLGILLYTLAQIVWSRLTGLAPLEATEGLIEHTRGELAPLVGADLAGLARHREEQRAYATHALAIANAIGGLMDTEDTQGDSQDDGNQDGEDDQQAQHIRLLLHFDQQDGDLPLALVETGESRTLSESESGYRVFTRRHDRELSARGLVRPGLLRELRGELDRRVARQGVNVPRLARRLAALLSSPARDGWHFGEEDGRLDGRRLSQLVSSPGERRLFHRERYRPLADSVLGILIDCSGSMKTHAASIAVLVDILGRALEQAGVASEVLGFTTGGWNGGQVMQEWLAAGRPAAPGRLNSLCHLVYKSADTPWRRARPHIAALLKPDLYREGIDGEAVEWACARLARRPEQRRLLLVISDGCPMDTATNLANDAYYLDNHLKQVVDSHRRRGDVSILGLGVGLDLSPYYDQCVALDLHPESPDSLGNEVFGDILQLLAQRLRS